MDLGNEHQKLLTLQKEKKSDNMYPIMEKCDSLQLNMSLMKPLTYWKHRSLMNM